MWYESNDHILVQVTRDAFMATSYDDNVLSNDVVDTKEGDPTAPQAKSNKTAARDQTGEPGRKRQRVDTAKVSRSVVIHKTQILHSFWFHLSFHLWARPFLFISE